LEVEIFVLEPFGFRRARTEEVGTVFWFGWNCGTGLESDSDIGAACCDDIKFPRGDVVDRITVCPVEV
jgi:hypothetical protein